MAVKGREVILCLMTRICRSFSNLGKIILIVWLYYQSNIDIVGEN